MTVWWKIVFPIVGACVWFTLVGLASWWFWSSI
jgi:hypothetical protein